MKIAIIGIRGTGKSTLAKELEKQYGTHVLFADKYIWDEDWNVRDKDNAKNEMMEVLGSKEDWIFEGNFTYITEYIFKNADMILYLDYSGIDATIGCLKRWWNYRKNSGEKPQKLELNYLLRKAFLRENRPKIEEAIKQYKPKCLKRINNRRILSDFLQHTKFNFSSHFID